MTVDKSLDVSNELNLDGPNTYYKNGLYEPNEKEKAILDNYKKRIEEYTQATSALRNTWDRIDDAYELRPKIGRAHV
jgi:hypothetical protein